MIYEFYLKFYRDRIGEDVREIFKECCCKGEQNNGDKKIISHISDITICLYRKIQERDKKVDGTGEKEGEKKGDIPSFKGGERDRERESKRETDRQRESQRERERDQKNESGVQRERDKERETCWRMEVRGAGI